MNNKTYQVKLISGETLPNNRVMWDSKFAHDRVMTAEQVFRVLIKFTEDASRSETLTMEHVRAGLDAGNTTLLVDMTTKSIILTSFEDLPVHSSPNQVQ